MKPSTPDEIMDAALDKLRPEIEQATGCFTRHLAEQLRNVPLACRDKRTLAIGYWATLMRAVMHRFAVFAGHDYPEGYAHHGSLTEVCRMKHDLQLHEMRLQSTPKQVIIRPQRFSVVSQRYVPEPMLIYGAVFYDPFLAKKGQEWVIVFFNCMSGSIMGVFPEKESPWPVMQEIMDKGKLKNFQWLDSDMNWPSHEEYLASLRD